MKQLRLNAQRLGALMQHHGNPTHYTAVEGGMWRRIPSTYVFLLRVDFVHAVRFAMDGAVWDEINGTRPKDMWIPDGSPELWRLS